MRKNDLYYSFLFLPESALTVNQPRSADVTSQCCPLHPRALDWQGGYAGGLSSGLCHCAVTLHLESYVSASSPTSCWFRLPLLLLSLLVLLALFLPLLLQALPQESPSDTRTSLCKSLCAHNSVNRNSDLFSLEEFMP